MKPFVWTRSETLALAAQKCSSCFGLGLRGGRSGRQTVCHCVLRAIFRACYARFRACAEAQRSQRYIAHVALEARPGRQRRTSWGMKNEEYMADFCLVARRTLSEREYAIFRYHFLLGAPWKPCCEKLRLDRGNFFHAVYRIERKLGMAYRTLEPYPLFPTDEYFASAEGRKRPELLDVLFPVEAEPEEESLAPAVPLKASAA